MTKLFNGHMASSCRRCFSAAAAASRATSAGTTTTNVFHKEAQISNSSLCIFFRQRQQQLVLRKDQASQVIAAAGVVPSGLDACPLKCWGISKSNILCTASKLSILKPMKCIFILIIHRQHTIYTRITSHRHTFDGHLLVRRCFGSIRGG